MLSMELAALLSSADTAASGTCSPAAGPGAQHHTKEED